jgi:hypothetical protein
MPQYAILPLVQVDLLVAKNGAIVSSLERKRARHTGYGHSRFGRHAKPANLQDEVFRCTEPQQS